MTGQAAEAMFAIDLVTASTAGHDAVADDGRKVEIKATFGTRGEGIRSTAGLHREAALLEPHHVDLARAISEVAGRHGAVADRGAVQEVQLAVAARPGELDVGFWRTVLGYDTLADDNGVDPLGHGSTVWMQDLDPGTVAARHACRRVGGP